MRRLLVVSVVVLVAGVVVSLAVAGGRAEGKPRPTGEIVFTRWAGDFDSSLFVVGLAEPRVRLLARDASAPAVSGDGRRIAFVRSDEIWVMRRDGSGQRQVTNPNKQPVKKGDLPPVSDNDPAWSPDGTTLYFSRIFWRTAMHYEYSLYSVRSDGTGLRRFTKTCDTDPAPSPNGRVVAFVSSERCERSLQSTVVAVTSAGRPTRLPFALPPSTWSMMFILSPAWSPDGNTLAYEAYDHDPDNRIGRSGLYVSRSDGSPPRRLARPTIGNAPVGNPSWSHDGTWITFDRAVGGQGPGDIWVVHPDGTATKQITKGKAGDTDPTWLLPPSS